MRREEMGFMQQCSTSKERFIKQPTTQRRDPPCGDTRVVKHIQMVLPSGQQTTPDPVLNKSHYFFEHVEIEQNKKCNCPRDVTKGNKKSDNVG
jgi:hypothetical protein